MKRTWMFAAAAMVSAVVGGGFALAAGVKTTVTAGLDASASGDSIAGKVKSDEKACVKGRKVKVIYRDAPAAPENVGSDEADRKGRYSVELDGFATPGTYTATVKKTTVDGTKCLPGFGVYEHRGGGGPAPDGGDHG